MKKREWSIALKSYIEAQRRQNPILDRDSLSDEEEWQCRIIGGEFIRWYENYLHDILSQRSALMINNFDPDPLIVITTTMPGLVAMHEIISKPQENIVYLDNEEFEAWEKKNPVDEFTFHIHHWSYFRSVDQKLSKQVRESFPSVNVDELRIHSNGDLWGDNCGVFGDHLWQWNGHEMALLEEAFCQGVY